MARLLVRRGYRILLRNHVTPQGELDLVAEKGGVVTFVEVKARRPGTGAGSADEALSPRKLARVARAAEHVLQRRGLAGRPVALLGAAVDLGPDGRPTDIRLLPVEEIR